MSDPNPPLRVVLVDDHPIIREGVRHLLEQSGGVSVVGQAGCGAQAVDVIKRLQPDIAVLDVNLPDANGVVLVRHLTTLSPATRSIILSVIEERVYVREALAAGARGYVLKRSAGEHLLHALDAVREGGLYLDATIADRILARPAHCGRADAVEPAREVITEREQDVMRYIALGFTTKEIAAKLNISMKSIDTHKVRACEKLNIRGRPKIVQYALLKGWLQQVGDEVRIPMSPDR